MFEDHVLEPTNPYAATKAGAEFIAKAYYRSFKLPIIITRGNNVYGPHQYPEKMIPKFINQLMRRRPLTVHGDGNNTRNFLYVEDVARAFDCILHKADIGRIYNIGGTNEYRYTALQSTTLYVKRISFS
jgi:UDP-glucose 4,6-dehydratase